MNNISQYVTVENTFIYNVYIDNLSDKIHLSPFFDCHVDSPDCALGHLHKIMRRRAALPYSIFLSGGDFGNCIWQGDPRYSGVEMRKEYTDTPDVADNLVESFGNKYGHLPWIGLVEGNHEGVIRKKHGTNIINRMCKRIKLPEWIKLVNKHSKKCNQKTAAFLGREGRIRLKMISNSGNSLCTLDIGYHHGAWGGKHAKGMIGAKEKMAEYDGVDLFLYGHIHGQNSDKIVKKYMTSKGIVVIKHVPIADCGSWKKNINHKYTTYSSARGYQTSPIGCPLITIQAQRNHLPHIEVLY